MSKKNYSVLIPFTGYVNVDVEGIKNKEEAIEMAFEKLNKENSFDEYIKYGELEYHEVVANGNCCSAVLNEIEVIEED